MALGVSLRNVELMLHDEDIEPVRLRSGQCGSTCRMWCGDRSLAGRRGRTGRAIKRLAWAYLLTDFYFTTVN